MLLLHGEAAALRLVSDQNAEACLIPPVSLPVERCALQRDIGLIR